MAIFLVTGPPGSGKSLYTTMRLLDGLRKRKWMATNVELKPGWEMAAARINSLSWVIPSRRRALAAGYRQRMFVSGDIGELMRLRLPGTGEGRGVLVMDEAHLWLNSRQWREGDRMAYIRWFTQHRKLGWDVYLITQRAQTIDAQIADLAEFEIKLRNLKRATLFGIPVTLGMNFFLALWSWHGVRGVKPVKREAFRLHRAVGGLYDTLQVHDTGGGSDLGTGEAMDIRVAIELDGRSPDPRSGASAPPRAGARGGRSRRTGGAAAPALTRYDPMTGARLRTPVPLPLPRRRLRPAWLGG